MNEQERGEITTERIAEFRNRDGELEEWEFRATNILLKKKRWAIQ